jgi:hypothetical protein
MCVRIPESALNRTADGRLVAAALIAVAAKGDEIERRNLIRDFYAALDEMRVIWKEYQNAGKH